MIISVDVILYYKINLSKRQCLCLQRIRCLTAALSYTVAAKCHTGGEALCLRLPCFELKSHILFIILISISNNPTFKLILPNAESAMLDSLWKKMMENWQSKQGDNP